MPLYVNWVGFLMDLIRNDEPDMIDACMSIIAMHANVIECWFNHKDQLNLNFCTATKI